MPPARITREVQRIKQKKIRDGHMAVHSPLLSATPTLYAL
jgi:hypothetical protein